MYALTQDEKYRTWALKVTDLWLEAAWKPQWGHFVRKIFPDGTSADVRMYGDGKYNTLAVLLGAYEATKNPQYLDSFWRMWTELQRVSGGGLIMEAFAEGTAVKDQGFDKQQTVFLELLTQAAKHSNSPERWRETTKFADLVMKAGEEVMRAEGGQSGTAFLRLALSRHQIARLALDLSTADGTLILHKGKVEILRQKVPTRWAVVYLPAGDYAVTLEREKGIRRRRSLSVAGQMEIAL
jgi:hypothetical protein